MKLPPQLPALKMVRARGCNRSHEVVIWPLREALDELSAVEAALADRLLLIEDARERCACRASLRPGTRQ